MAEVEVESKDVELSRGDNLRRLWARHNTSNFTGWAGRHNVYGVADQSGSSMELPPIKQGITWLRLFRLGQAKDQPSEHVNVKEAGGGGAKGTERADGSYLSSWRFTMADQMHRDGFLHPSYQKAAATRSMRLTAPSDAVFGMVPTRLARWGKPDSLDALFEGSPIGKSTVWMEAFFYGRTGDLDGGGGDGRNGRQSLGVAYDSTFKLWVHLQTWEPVWVELEDPAGPQPLDVAAHMAGQVEGAPLGEDLSRWLDDLPAARRVAPRSTTLRWEEGADGADGRLVACDRADMESGGWGDAPTVPEGFCVFRYTDRTYTIVPLDLHTPLGPEPAPPVSQHEAVSGASDGSDALSDAAATGNGAAALLRVSAGNGSAGKGSAGNGRGSAVPWVAEFGALGYDGQWARLRVYYRRDGALDRLALIEY